MLTRRQFISMVASAGGSLALQGCSFDRDRAVYEEAVGNIWHQTRGIPDRSLKQELVRYAALAPSSHNTQAWKFRIEEKAVSILPDFNRRCMVVDPDDHHLFVSLGCATENMVQAALASGFQGEVSFDAAAGDTIRIGLMRTNPVISQMFGAITKRQCTRTEFDGKPLSSAELKLLEKAGAGNGVEVLLLTEKPALERLLEFIVQGNLVQMNEPAFVAELKDWIRFSDAEAVFTGDGLSTRATGNPTVPRWLGSALFSLFFTPGKENDKYARHVRSSAGIAVFVSDADDKSHWVQTGRAYERFALQAAALGIRNAHLNQPVEVVRLRHQLADFLGIDNRRPDLVVRFGRGPEMPHSLRRPVEAVLT